MTIPIVRKRVKRPKTKTGCRTCRTRRIKCDEGRPICQRCSKSKRHCEGYDVPEPSSDAASTPASSNSVLIRAPEATSLKLNDKQGMALQFFRSFTVMNLPGNGSTVSWERVVLQQSHDEPAIMMAATALGAIHRSRDGFEEVPVEATRFAIEQYNQAMGMTRNYLEVLKGRSCSLDRVETVLFLSLLFFCFEMFNGEDERATIHMQTGLRILREALNGNDKIENADEPYVVTVRAQPRSAMDALIATFSRFDADLTTFGLHDSFLSPICDKPLPVSFSNIDEANAHLDHLMTNVFDTDVEVLEIAEAQIARSTPAVADNDDVQDILKEANRRIVPLPLELSSAIETSRRDIRSWMSAFATVEVSDSNRIFRLQTQIVCFWIWVVIETWRDPTETLCDRFDEQFAHIINVAEEYIATRQNMFNDLRSRSHSTTKQSQTPPGFTLGLGFVACILMIGLRCRTSTVRRRSVTLMRTINLRGIYDSFYLAALMQTTIDREEEETRTITGMTKTEFECHEIPEEARFLEADITPCRPKTAARRRYYQASTGRLVWARYRRGPGSEIIGGEISFDVER